MREIHAQFILSNFANFFAGHTSNRFVFSALFFQRGDSVTVFESSFTTIVTRETKGRSKFLSTRIYRFTLEVKICCWVFIFSAFRFVQMIFFNLERDSTRFAIDRDISLVEFGKPDCNAGVSVRGPCVRVYSRTLRRDEATGCRQISVAFRMRTSGNAYRVTE